MPRASVRGASLAPNAAFGLRGLAGPRRDQRSERFGPASQPPKQRGASAFAADASRRSWTNRAKRERTLRAGVAAARAAPALRFCRGRIASLPRTGRRRSAACACACIVRLRGRSIPLAACFGPLRVPRNQRGIRVARPRVIPARAAPRLNARTNRSQRRGDPRRGRPRPRGARVASLPSVAGETPAGPAGGAKTAPGSRSCAHRLRRGSCLWLAPLASFLLPGSARARRLSRPRSSPSRLPAAPIAPSLRSSAAGSLLASLVGGLHALGCAVGCALRARLLSAGPLLGHLWGGGRCAALGPLFLRGAAPRAPARGRRLRVSRPWGGAGSAHEATPRGRRLRVSRPCVARAAPTRQKPWLERKRVLLLRRLPA